MVHTENNSRLEPKNVASSSPLKTPVKKLKVKRRNSKKVKKVKVNKHIRSQSIFDEMEDLRGANGPPPSRQDLEHQEEQVTQ